MLLITYRSLFTLKRKRLNKNKHLRYVIIKNTIWRGGPISDLKDRDNDVSVSAGTAAAHSLVIFVFAAQ